MRVTHIITRLVVGGAQENTLATIRGLRQKPGLQVNLISGPTIGPEGSLEGEAAGIPDLLTILPELVRPVHPLKDFIALGKLEAILRTQKPDIVHTHSGKAGILGRLAARRGWSSDYYSSYSWAIIWKFSGPPGFASSLRPRNAMPPR